MEKNIPDGEKLNPPFSKGDLLVCIKKDSPDGFSEELILGHTYVVHDLEYEGDEGFDDWYIFASIASSNCSEGYRDYHESHFEKCRLTVT